MLFTEFFECFTKAGCNILLFIVGVRHEINIIAAQRFVSFLSVYNGVIMSTGLFYKIKRYFIRNSNKERCSI